MAHCSHSVSVQAAGRESRDSTERYRADNSRSRVGVKKQLHTHNSNTVYSVIKLQRTDLDTELLQSRSVEISGIRPLELPFSILF